MTSEESPPKGHRLSHLPLYLNCQLPLSQEGPGTHHILVTLCSNCYLQLQSNQNLKQLLSYNYHRSTKHKTHKKQLLNRLTVQ